MPNSHMLQIGECVAEKFEVTKHLGTGSLGEELYLGRHLKLERDVTVRVLPESIAADKELLERFFQAIRLTAVLQHPNILPAFEAGEDRGRHYLITASEKGFFLNEYLDQRGKIDESEALRVIIALTEALQFAWEKHKILHRNIRPETILIAKGNEPMLTDFGMAKSLADNKDLTVTGYTVGNPHYMSPEQVQARQDLDFRSDIYCLGLVFYHMLVGNPPFHYGSQLELMSAQIKQPHIPVVDMNPLVSASCSAVIDIMLAKDRNQRYQSWDDLLKALMSVQEKRRLPTGTHASSSPPPKKANTSKKPDIAPEGGTGDAFVNPMGRSSFPASTMVILLLIIVIGALATGIVIHTNKLAAQKKAKDQQELELKVAADRVEQERLEQEKKEAEAKKAEEEERKVKDVECQEHWDKAMAFAQTVTPENGEYDNAIAQFEELRKALTDSKFEAMAETEIVKLKTLRQKAVDEVMSTLADSAKEQVDGKRLDKAIAVYTGYKGSLEKETADLRKNAAQEIQAIADKAKDEARKAEESAKKRKDEFLAGVVVEVLKGNFEEASAKLKGFEDKASLADAEKALAELLSADTMILDSYKNDIGKEIVLENKGAKEAKGAFKIAKVDGGKIFVEQKIGKATIGKPLLPRDLPAVDRLSRLRQAKISKPALAIYAGLIAIAAKQTDKAAECFKEAGSLSEALLQQLEQSK